METGNCMKHGSLFSGIGGFDLAAEWMGWKNVFHCEKDPFCRIVLKYHFPEAKSFSDITKTDFKKYANKIDILTGGFPCQPFSLAGKRKGKDDERYLWGEMLRAIQEIKPKCIIAENVYGIVNIDGGMVFEQVCLDLENEGYEVQPFIIPACAKNAPHRRDRVWFVANTGNAGVEGLRQKRENKVYGFENAPHPNKLNGNLSGFGTSQVSQFEASGIFNDNASNTSSTGRRQDNWKGKSGLNNEKSTSSNWENFPTQSPILGRNDGIPEELGFITVQKWRKESIKAYGNAIVPQVAYEIFKAIESNDNI